MWLGIKDIAGSVMDLVVQVLKGFIAVMFSLGKSIFNALWDGLKSVWTSIATWISDKTDAIKEFLGFASSNTIGSTGMETSMGIFHDWGATDRAIGPDPILINGGITQVSISPELYIDGQLIAGGVSAVQGLATARAGVLS